MTTGAFDEKERWTAQTCARLEFLSEPRLTALIRDLLAAHPVQYIHVKKVIEKLGDAIPPEFYSDVAEWAVRFDQHAQTVDPFAQSLGRIEYLSSLLPEIPSEHSAWSSLSPIIEVIFGVTALWQAGDTLVLKRVLQYAPLPLALRAMDIMLDIRTLDEGAVRARWRVLCYAAANRSELSKARATQIITAVPLREDLATLSEQVWAKGHLPPDDLSILIHARSHLDEILKESVMSDGQKNFRIGSAGWEIMLHVRWEIKDERWLRDLVAVINHPRVLDNNLGLLLAYLIGMVDGGPTSFADTISQQLLMWLETPPIGIDPFANQSGPFSIIQFNRNPRSEIIERLLQLASSVRKKIDGRDGRKAL